MENASKALLIAAAILIAIILVCLGMKVFNSVNDTKQYAQDVGSGISSATQNAKDEVSSSIGSGGTLKIGDEITTDDLLKALKIDKDDYIGNYNGKWVVIGKADGKTKLVTKENVKDDVTLGCNPFTGKGDPNASGSNTIEKAIDSYNQAISTLKTIAIAGVGNIAQKTTVRSINIEDLNSLTGEKLGSGNPEYDKTFKYYYLEEGRIGTYVQNEKKTFGNVYKLFRTNNKIIDESNPKEEITLKEDWYKYNLKEEKLNKGKYWLASQCVDCFLGYACFGVRTVNNGSVDYTTIFTSTGSASSWSYGVRAVVLI